jgi:hypothetical protein
LGILFFDDINSYFWGSLPGKHYKAIRLAVHVINYIVAMKKLLSVALLVSISLLMAVPDAEAQRYNKRNRYATVGVRLEAMNYWGDIVPQPTIGSFYVPATRPKLAVDYTYKFGPRISGRAGLSWGRITGDDSRSASREGDNVYRNIRNLSFRNDIKELSFVGIVDLNENRRSYLRRPKYNYYAFAGVSVFHHNPKAYIEGDPRLEEGWYALQPLGTEGQQVDGVEDYPRPYRRIQIAIPFGIGFKYRLDRRWDIGFEIGIRKTFTDYLDDVSTNYAAKSDLLNQGDRGMAAAILSDRSALGNRNIPPNFNVETQVIGGVPFQNVSGWGTKGAQRGDPSDQDWFFTTGVQLSYILRPNIRSPKFR